MSYPEPQFGTSGKPDSSLAHELAEQKNIVRQLYSLIVRTMVVLKQIVRAGACVATWFYIGHREAYFLLGFIVVVGVFQLAIDRARQTVVPNVKLSEWNFL